MELNFNLTLNKIKEAIDSYEKISTPPQAPDRFNPKVTVNTCGIIQKLYETKHIETMTFGKSVMAHFSKIEPKTSK